MFVSTKKKWNQIKRNETNCELCVNILLGRILYVRQRRFNNIYIYIYIYITNRFIKLICWVVARLLSLSVCVFYPSHIARLKRSEVGTQTRKKEKEEEEANEKCRSHCPILRVCYMNLCIYEREKKSVCERERASETVCFNMNR